MDAIFRNKVNRQVIADAYRQLGEMREDIRRKVAAPHGDGSRCNLVNAETDVLPRLEGIMAELLRSPDA